MLEAALVIGGIGLLAALGLGLSARFLAVRVDPKVAEVRDALLGANCGACGFAGCAAAAEAVARGEATAKVCVAGGDEIAQAVARVMGQRVTRGEPAVAELGCKHGPRTSHLRFDYAGVPDCRAAVLVAGGGKVCSMGCLGLGTCVRACPFDALFIGPDGLATVIAERCTACGTCERVCPQGIIRVQRASRRFTHVQTEADCLAPCQATCPAQIDIPAYIQAVADGRHLEAVQIIKRSNPLPLVCGRVCPHPCEQVCRRGLLDQPVGINHLKRFAADFEMRTGRSVLPEKLPDTGKRVAIVGAGPAGLTCAYYLAWLGHRVTLLEAMPRPGGMLRYGIPSFRLPKEVLDWEIRAILDLGIELRCGQRLGRDFDLEALGAQGFEAVFLAIGAWASKKLMLSGEDELAGIQSGTDFLVRHGLGEPRPVGQRVVVVGGGNTAMDAARTAWRLGASHVYLLYRRSRGEMPAHEAEVAAGEREGIQYRFLTAPTRLLGVGGKLTGIEVQGMRLGEPDGSGRRRPVPIPGDLSSLEADQVLAAIGQNPDLGCLPGPEGPCQVERTRWNTLAAEEGTGRTDVPGIFTGGDACRGAATAVEAIRDGRFAARAIDLQLRGEPVALPDRWHVTPPRLPGIEPGVSLPVRPRERMPEVPLEERQGSFEEVELGLTEEAARRESARCLQCGLVCYRGYRGPDVEKAS
jgi:NADPH-dependent glutamate synthase beta subunit-like oxidoreductase